VFFEVEGALEARLAGAWLFSRGALFRLVERAEIDLPYLLFFPLFPGLRGLARIRRLTRFKGLAGRWPRLRFAGRGAGFDFEDLSRLFALGLHRYRFYGNLFVLHLPRHRRLVVLKGLPAAGSFPGGLFVVVRQVEKEV